VRRLPHGPGRSRARRPGRARERLLLRRRSRRGGELVLGAALGHRVNDGRSVLYHRPDAHTRTIPRTLTGITGAARGPVARDSAGRRWRGYRSGRPRSSERPRHHQRELLSPELVAVRSDALAHDGRPHLHHEAQPPTSPRSQGRTVPAFRRRGTRAEANPASAPVALRRSSIWCFPGELGFPRRR
jgi:hypothetical protein